MSSGSDATRIYSQLYSLLPLLFNGVIPFHNLKQELVVPQPRPISTYSNPVTVTRRGVKGRGKKVFGLESILTELRVRRSRAIGDGKAETKVGYSASYAVPVHEILTSYHPVGQAKFLEQPLRTEEKQMGDIIRARLRARETLKAAQLAAAKHLISISLQLVPVDTGALRDSWFIN
jgi:hypothetical protein